MISNLQNIVQEIDVRANADSITSANKHKITQVQADKAKAKREKAKGSSNPSLSSRMANRLEKYKRFMSKPTTEEYDTKQSYKSGNNPVYNYPSVHPPMPYDPKYSRNNKDKYTKFATKSLVGGKEVNLLETVGKVVPPLSFRTVVPAPEIIQREDGCPAVPEVPRRHQRKPQLPKGAQVSEELQI